MLIKEYRIVLPMSIEEFHIGQLYTVIETSKEQTGGGEGVEVLKNEPYTNGTPLLGDEFTAGQFTHKLYHLESRVPFIVRKSAPKGALKLHEEAWNAYPYCRTVITNPDYMKDNFCIKVESMHIADAGTTENAHKLSPELLAKREVVHIDIASKTLLKKGDYKPETDPTLFHSGKTNRGPLKADWQKTTQPIMCAYKLVTVHFKWFGLQGRIESMAQNQYPRLFCKFHRDAFCTIDKWHGMTMADIRVMEEKAQAELKKQLEEGSLKGMKTDSLRAH